jgi:hypothetical protein
MELEHFLTISLMLFTTWAASFLAFHVASVLIHMLLVLAVMFLVGHLVSDDHDLTTPARASQKR